MPKKKRQGEEYITLSCAKLDVSRHARRGVPEIIFAPGKSHLQLRRIVSVFKKNSPYVMISRLSKEQYARLHGEFPALAYFEEARIGFLGKRTPGMKGNCLVVTAGTGDIPVAEEAAVFLELTGNKVRRIYDVGVAGLHRLTAHAAALGKAKVIVVAAGMEGALASVVSGLSRCPVIAVPTSIGYGASFKGLSALLGMINSCSLGVSVVNIDNGLGAGYMAHLVNT